MVLDSRYILDAPLEWEMDEDQAYPAWTGVMHTEWRFYGPARVEEAAAEDEGYSFDSETGQFE